MTLSADDIQDLYLWRQQQFAGDHERWDVLSAIWHGQHHKLFPAEFRRGQVPKLTGFIRRSWKMFARLIAKQLPDIYVGSRTLDETMTKQADEIEKICYTYYNVWDFERKLRAIATYEVGFGAFGIGVVPHGRLGWPIVLVEDPRNIFPSADWTSTSSVSSFNSLVVPSDLGGSLSDVIVRKMMTGRDLRQMHPGHPELMALIPDTVDAFRQNYPVLQFYDNEYWVTTLADSQIQLKKTGHGAPWCPWQFACTFAPNAPAGDSDFFQQIGLEIAFMRLLDQKLALNDAVTWPWMALSGGWEIDPNRRLLEAYCVSEDTEILTADGWKTYTEIQPGQAVLTLDPATLESEWQPLQGVNVFTYKGDVIEMEGRTHSSVTTPNHRWLVRERNHGRERVRWRTTETLTQYSAIPKAAECRSLPTEPKYADEMVELIAWFWTEGSVEPHDPPRHYLRGQIAQSHRVNAQYVGRIRHCLRAVFGPPAVAGKRGGGLWSESANSRGMTFFALRAEAVQTLLDLAPHKMPTAAFVGSLTRSQLLLFIETSMDADGFRSPGRGTIVQRKPDALSILQMAASLLGLSSSLRHRSDQDMWVLTLGQGTFVNPRNAQKQKRQMRIERKPFEGIVWCPSVPNQVWLARRRGLVFFTGNSTEAKAQMLSPPAQFQVDRDSKVLSDLLRLFNMETEATQGQITGGPITGRGIAELNAGPVVGTLQDFFADLAYYFRRMFNTALIQDREVFGDQKKDLAGWGRGDTFFGEYTPMKVIGEKFGPLRVEFGPGVGGFEGHLQLLQSLGAEALSLETAMEKNPHIRSVITEKRRVVLERLENVLWTIAIEGKAAVPIDWIAGAWSAISKGAHPVEWVLANPPGQAQAIPENVAPIPPELAAAAQGPEGAPAQPAMVNAPPLEQLLGIGG